MIPHQGTPSACSCGCENFQRVVVERVLGRPITTDLLACVECSVVYYSPLPKPEARVPPPEHGLRSFREAPFRPKGWIDPADEHRGLMAQVDAAAKDYVKPGRSPRLKPGGRR